MYLGVTGCNLVFRCSGERGVTDAAVRDQLPGCAKHKDKAPVVKGVAFLTLYAVFSQEVGLFYTFLDIFTEFTLQERFLFSLIYTREVYKYGTRRFGDSRQGRKNEVFVIELA